MHARKAGRTPNEQRKEWEREEISQTRAPNPAAAGEMHTAVEKEREREEERSQETKQNTFFHDPPYAVSYTGRDFAFEVFYNIDYARTQEKRGLSALLSRSFGSRSRLIAKGTRLQVLHGTRARHSTSPLRCDR